MAAVPHPRRVVAATVVAMVAFASNSILCRLALAPSSIDPASFTGIRIASGAATLALILAASKRGGRTAAPPSRAGWISAFFLFLYAIAFSWSYVTLSAGTGALILFGCVQATMWLTAWWSGVRPRWVEWLGLTLALAGLVYLVRPGIAAPSPAGAALMAGAGVSWGVYSLRGRGSPDPLSDTARNFLCAVPFAAFACVLAVTRAHAERDGVVYAIVSGALSSGVGYVIWYTALRGLSATRAATVQLSVPVLAALGGVAFLGETFSLRLALAAVMILGGIALALAAHRR